MHVERLRTCRLGDKLGWDSRRCCLPGYLPARPFFFPLVCKSPPPPFSACDTPAIRSEPHSEENRRCGEGVTSEPLLLLWLGVTRASDSPVPCGLEKILCCSSFWRCESAMDGTVGCAAPSRSHKACFFCRRGAESLVRAVGKKGVPPFPSW